MTTSTVGRFHRIASARNARISLCAASFRPPHLTAFFTHGTTLAYRTYGHGPQVMIALHGFGRDGTDMQVLEQALSEVCTIHAFDLHLHGQSPAYPGRVERPFTPEELADYFIAFLDELKAPKAVILGFSLGGRIAMSLLEHMPHRIERVFLVAPDGLLPRPWYRGLAGTHLGRKAYQRFITHPVTVHFMMDALRALRLIGERMHRFLKGQTDSRAKRQLVRDVWLCYRLIEPEPARVAKVAVHHGIMIHLVFGELDRIIPARLGIRLKDHATGNVDQHTLPVGHMLMTPELGELVRQLVGTPRTGTAR